MTNMPSASSSPPSADVSVATPEDTHPDPADAAVAPQAPPALEEWGDLALAAQAAGSLKPAWKKFIKTKFFVAILRSPDDNPKNFLLYTTPHPDDGKATLIIAEVRDRLGPPQGDGTVALWGADILRRLEDQGSIAVVLREGVFNISRKRVDWLRSGIAVTTARVVIRKILLAAAPAAPLPVLRIATESALEQELELDQEPEPEASNLSLLVSVLKTRNAMLAMLAVVAAGVLAVVLVPEDAAPDTAHTPPPFEAPVPAPRVAGAELPAAATATSSVVFRPVYNSFSVNVPGLAEEVELSPDQVRQLGDVETHQYRLLAGELMYSMEASDYGDRAPADVTVAMDTTQSLIVGNDGQLISSKPIALRGATGREVRVRLSNGSERAARYAFIGSKYCMVMVTAPPGDRSAAQIAAFLDSFQLN